MRYRALDANGDYTFGSSSANFLVDSPEAVAQAILTRLQLQTNEWFLDITEGTPYREQILGHGTQLTRDAALRARVLGTPNVTGLVDYASTLDGARNFAVSAKANTAFGTTGQITVPL